MKEKTAIRLVHVTFFELGSTPRSDKAVDLYQYDPGCKNRGKTPTLTLICFVPCIMLTEIMDDHGLFTGSFWG